MSNIVSGLCYRAKFGCPKRKAVAVALGDHAHDDGTSIFPSVKRLASKVEWSERTVQRVLRELEEIGLLIVVSEGGGGPKDTRNWVFNMDLLRDLADGVKAIESTEKGDCETPLEGDSLTPMAGLRVSTVRERVSTTTAKGDSSVTQTITNHQRTSNARAREGENLKLEVKAHRPVVTVVSGEAAWSSWMEQLKRLGRDDLVESARDIGKLTAHSRWPTGDELPTIANGKGLSSRSRAMTGDAD